MLEAFRIYGKIDLEGGPEANRELDRIDSKGRSAASSIGNFARGIGKVAAGIGVFALLRKGVDLVRDSIGGAFERIDTMEQFERVMSVMIDDTDAVAASMDRLKDIVEGTSMRTDVMANGIQNFVTRGMEIGQATDTVEAWGNAVAFYGDGSNEQFSNVTDALQNMVAKGKVGMDQLNRLYDSGIPAVEMYADAVGMETEEVESALSNGEIAAEDFVDTVTESLMKGTDEFPSVAGAMEDLGMSWGSVLENMGNYAQQGMEKIITAIDDLLENNGLPDMRSMIDKFGQSFGDKLSWIADNVIPKVGDAIQFFKDKLDEWKPTIDKVKNAFTPFIETVMETSGKFKSDLIPIWEDLKGLFDSLRPILELVGAAVLVMYGIWLSTSNAIVAAIGPIINAVVNLVDFVVNVVNAIIALLTGDFAGAWEYLGEAGQSALDFFMNLLDGVLDFLVTFVETIIDFFYGLYMTLVGNSIIPDMVEAIIEWFHNLFEWLVEIVSEIVENVVEYFMNLYETAVEIFGTFWEFLVEIWGYISETFENALEFILALVEGDFEGMKEAIENQMENAREFLAEVWQLIKDYVAKKASEILSNITKRFIEIKDNIKEKITDAKDALVNRFTEMVTNAKNKVQEILKNIISKFNEIKNNITNKIAEAKTALVNKFTEMVTSAKNKAQEIVNAAKEKFEAVKQGIRNKLTEAVTVVGQKISEMPGKVMEFFSNMVDSGKMLVSGLINGIKQMGSKAIEAVTGVVDGVISKAKGLLKIESPSKLFTEFGGFIPEGLAIGIDKMKSMAEKASEALAGGVEGSFNPELSVDNVGGISKLKDIAVDSVFGNMPKSNFSVNETVAVTNSNSQITELLNKQNELLMQLLNKNTNLVMNDRILAEEVEPVVTEIQDRNNKIKADFK